MANDKWHFSDLEHVRETCHREMEELRKRLSQSNGAASNGSSQKAEREAGERVSAAEARARQAEAKTRQAEAGVRQAEAETAAARAEVNTMRGAPFSPLASENLQRSWWGPAHRWHKMLTLCKACAEFDVPDDLLLFGSLLLYN